MDVKVMIAEMKEEKALEANWAEQMVEDIAAKETSYYAIILSDEGIKFEN